VYQILFLQLILFFFRLDVKTPDKDSKAINIIETFGSITASQIEIKYYEIVSKL